MTRYVARKNLMDPKAIQDLNQAIALLNEDLDTAQTKLDRIDALIEKLSILE